MVTDSAHNPRRAAWLSAPPVAGKSILRCGCAHAGSNARDPMHEELGGFDVAGEPVRLWLVLHQIRRQAGGLARKDAGPVGALGMPTVLARPPSTPAKPSTAACGWRANQAV